MQQNLLEKFIKHPIIDVFGASPVQFGDLFRVRAVRVERTELAARVTEQHEEVLGFGSRDLLQNPPLRFRVYGAGEHAVLYGVKHYAAVRFRRRLLVESRACNIFSGYRNCLQFGAFFLLFFTGYITLEVLENILETTQKF